MFTMQNGFGIPLPHLFRMQTHRPSSFKIPLVLEQFYPWWHFTSFYSSIFEKLLADSMDVSVEVSANSGKF